MPLSADERIKEHEEIEEHEARKVQETLENQALNSKHKATEADKTRVIFPPLSNEIFQSKSSTRMQWQWLTIYKQKSVQSFRT